MSGVFTSPSSEALALTRFSKLLLLLRCPSLKAGVGGQVVVVVYLREARAVTGATGVEPTSNSSQIIAVKASHPNHLQQHPK